MAIIKLIFYGDKTSQSRICSSLDNNVSTDIINTGGHCLRAHDVANRAGVIFTRLLKLRGVLSDKICVYGSSAAARAAGMNMHALTVIGAFLVGMLNAVISVFLPISYAFQNELSSDKEYQNQRCNQQTFNHHYD